MGDRSHCHLRFLFIPQGECNYGGRVTDEWDRRTLNTILERFYCMDVIAIDRRYLFDISGLYYVPPVSEHSEFVDYVRELPMITAPSVFGMHDNADIIKDQQETYLMLSSALSTQVLDAISSIAADYRGSCSAFPSDIETLNCAGRELCQSKGGQRERDGFKRDRIFQ